MNSRGEAMLAKWVRGRESKIPAYKALHFVPSDHGLNYKLIAPTMFEISRQPMVQVEIQNSCMGELKWRLADLRGWYSAGHPSRERSLRYESGLKELG